MAIILKPSAHHDDRFPVYVYQMQFRLPDGLTVWKVGISRDPEERLCELVHGMNISGRIIYQRRYDTRAEALAEEARLLEYGRCNRLTYGGMGLLTTGNIELLTAPIVDAATAYRKRPTPNDKKVYKRFSYSPFPHTPA
jgi:hypothetical protein